MEIKSRVGLGTEGPLTFPPSIVFVAVRSPDGAQELLALFSADSSTVKDVYELVKRNWNMQPGTFLLKRPLSSDALAETGNVLSTLGLGRRVRLVVHRARTHMNATNARGEGGGREGGEKGI